MRPSHLLAVGGGSTPPSTGTRPATIIIIVLLPQPLGPSTLTNSFWPSVKDTSETASTTLRREA